MAMFHHELQRAARARRLADQLRPLCPTQRHAMIAQMVSVNGGTLLRPDNTSQPGTHMFQISVLDVSGHGDSLDAAIADWITAARRATPLNPKQPHAA